MTTEATAPLHGLVMAGGASTRMGRDKAALMLPSGETLLDRQFGLLEPLCDQVFVSVAPAQANDSLRMAYPTVTDLVADGGPAAGLAAAHQLHPEAAWLVITCDMPGLNSSALSELVAGRARNCAATAFVAADGGPEPLCAIWEPVTLAALFARVREGKQPGPRGLLAKQDVRLIEPANPDLLANVNTPGDWSDFEAREAHD